MHKLSVLMILCGVVGGANYAMAQAPTAPAAPAAPVAVKLGKILSSSDGHRLGRIDQLDKSKDGVVETVELFSDQGVLTIPVSTISANGSSLVTSLSYADATKAK